MLVSENVLSNYHQHIQPISQSLGRDSMPFGVGVVLKAKTKERLSDFECGERACWCQTVRVFHTLLLPYWDFHAGTRQLSSVHSEWSQQEKTSSESAAVVWRKMPR